MTEWEVIDTPDGLKPVGEVIGDLVTNGGAYALWNVITMKPGTVMTVNGPHGVYALRMDEDGPNLVDVSRALKDMLNDTKPEGTE